MQVGGNGEPTGAGNIDRSAEENILPWEAGEIVVCAGLALFVCTVAWLILRASDLSWRNEGSFTFRPAKGKCIRFKGNVQLGEVRKSGLDKIHTRTWFVVSNEDLGQRRWRGRDEGLGGRG